MKLKLWFPIGHHSIENAPFSSCSADMCAEMPKPPCPQPPPPALRDKALSHSQAGPGVDLGHQCVLSLPQDIQEVAHLAGSL